MSDLSFKSSSTAFNSLITGLILSSVTGVIFSVVIPSSSSDFSLSLSLLMMMSSTSLASSVFNSYFTGNSSFLPKWIFKSDKGFFALFGDFTLEFLPFLPFPHFFFPLTGFWRASACAFIYFSRLFICSWSFKFISTNYSLLDRKLFCGFKSGFYRYSNTPPERSVPNEFYFINPLSV